MKQNNPNNKGSIGITVVMLVFCFMMSVTMAYHKQLQTETVIHKQIDLSDRAMDAAFSGVNYAIATIQAEKKVFAGTKKVFFESSTSRVAIGGTSENTTIQSKWVCLDRNMQFSNYYDDKTKTSSSGEIESDRNPPYRFKVACTDKFYFLATDTLYIKSIGEYIQYSGTDKMASYTAQIIAECQLNKTAKTIRIKKYRKMFPNESKLFTFTNYAEN